MSGEIVDQTQKSVNNRNNGGDYYYRDHSYYYNQPQQFYYAQPNVNGDSSTIYDRENYNVSHNSLGSAAGGTNYRYFGGQYNNSDWLRVGRPVGQLNDSSNSINFHAPQGRGSRISQHPVGYSGASVMGSPVPYNGFTGTQFRNDIILNGSSDINYRPDAPIRGNTVGRSYDDFIGDSYRSQGWSMPDYMQGSYGDQSNTNRWYGMPYGTNDVSQSSGYYPVETMGHFQEYGQVQSLNMFMSSMDPSVDSDSLGQSLVSANGSHDSVTLPKQSFTESASTGVQQVEQGLRHMNLHSEDVTKSDSDLPVTSTSSDVASSGGDVHVPLSIAVSNLDGQRSTVSDLPRSLPQESTNAILESRSSMRSASSSNPASSVSTSETISWAKIASQPARPSTSVVPTISSKGLGRGRGPVPLTHWDSGRSHLPGRSISLVSTATSESHIYSTVDQLSDCSSQDRKGDDLSCKSTADSKDSNPTQPKAVRDSHSSVNACGNQTNLSDTKKSASPVYDVPKSVETLLATLQREINPAVNNLNLTNALFFVIKSYSEDDVHRSIKYKIWCSTQHGNKRLDDAYRRNSGRGPIYLLYSVNGSGHFCGVAQMMSSVDYNSTSNVWAQDDKWRGSFKVSWIYVKDVPNSQLRHIRLENNENKPVTYSRDAQEVPHAKGKEVIWVIHNYRSDTSLFDDFVHYEKRQNQQRRDYR